MTIARPDRAFFLIALAGAVAYVSLPRDGVLYGRWFQLFPIAAVIALLVGVTAHRPRSRAPVVPGGGERRCAGSPRTPCTRSSTERLGVVPFPSVADLLALVSYVILAVALHLMLR